MPTILIAAVAFATLMLVLGAIVRFSIVSRRRTRGADDRLGQPDEVGVERVCGFPPPAGLAELYRDGSLTRLFEIWLADTTRQPRKTWFVGRFFPLTGADVLEQRKIHGIATGIPIADDMDKGVYFVTREGKVMFRAAGREREEMQVAPSVEAFARFEAGEPSAGEA